jgi:hypothetical protein
MFSRQLNLSLLFAMALSATPLATALADPPPWAPAHGYRAKHDAVRYEYHYYPSYEVYYEPSRSLWFWFDDGDWHLGPRLPIVYAPVHFRNHVTVELDSPDPYFRHAYVVEKYGGKQGKRH